MFIKKYKCNYCNKEISGNSNILACHIQYCDCNPNKEKIKVQRKIALTKTANEKRGNLLTKTTICEYCNKEFTYSYYENLTDPNPRFCNNVCAHAYVTKSSLMNPVQTKTAVCTNCNNSFEVSKFRDIKNFLCDNCKPPRKRAKRIYKPKPSKPRKVRSKTDNEFGLDLSILENKKAVKSTRHHNRFYKSHNWNCRKLLPFQCPICGEYNCDNDYCKNWNTQSIITLHKYFNFDVTKLGTLEVFNEFDRIKNFLYNEYCIKKVPFLFIANKVGAVDKTVYNIIVKFGLNTINHNPTHVNYQRGYYTTWLNDKVYLRSSYEFNYAYKLDLEKVNYKVEPFSIIYYDTQQKKNRKYTPDFYLIDTNTIVEIKGNFTYNEINVRDKFDACKKLGYNCKLIYGPKMEELNL